MTFSNLIETLLPIMSNCFLNHEWKLICFLFSQLMWLDLIATLVSNQPQKNLTKSDYYLPNKTMIEKGCLEAI